MQFKQTRLDNGLEIVAEVNPSAASMAAGFFVRTGSRDERPAWSGVSHFLEHMVFKGTPTRSAMDVNRRFDELGANYNAFTSEENTVYYAAVLPEFQDDVLELLGDLMRPSLREDDFEMERNVILEEIAVYEDQPRFRVYDHLMSTYFRGHPLGNVILGTTESIRHLRAEDMREYLAHRYAPGNLTLVAVGNVDFDGLVDTARSVCGDWPAADAPRLTPDTTGNLETMVLVDDKLAREHIGLMSHAPSAQDDRHHAAHLAATIVGDSSGSRLYYALVEPALVDEASLAYNPMDGTGAFMTFLSTTPDRTAEVLRITMDEFRRFAEEGPTEAELQAAKNKTASGATIRGEVPMGRLVSVGHDWQYRREYVPLAEQLEQMYAVGIDAIRELMSACDLTACATLALGAVERM